MLSKITAMNGHISGLLRFHTWREAQAMSVRDDEDSNLGVAGAFSKSIHIARFEIQG